MIRRGFTVVELVITITIMGILLALAVVNLSATEARSRDSERKADAENIAMAIENYYANADSDVFMSGGSYLGTEYIYGTVAGLRQYLPDLDIKNMYSPTADNTGTISLVGATNAVATPTGVSPKPSSSNDIYVYQALKVDNSICIDPFLTNESGCRKFNIYYYQEVTDTVEVITSRRQ